MENFNKNLELVNIDYFNALNSLKNVSIKKFVEHIVDTNETPRSMTTASETNPNEPMIISREEREINLLNKFKSAITKSLENLNIKNLIDVGRNDQEVQSNVDDDNVSVTSSKLFHNNLNKTQKNIKLPYIIGTHEFFKSEFLGTSVETVMNSNPVQSEDTNLNRKVSSVLEMNIDLGVLDKSSQGNLNNGTNSNNIPSLINNSQNKPNVPNTSPSNVPNIPNPPRPGAVPPVPKNPVIPKKNSAMTNNLLENKIQKDIKSETIDEEPKNNPNPISFKDNLALMFNGGKKELPKQTLIQEENISSVPQAKGTLMMNNQPEITTGPKQIRLDNFVKRGNMFDNLQEDDDEEDHTGLFKKNFNQNIKPIQRNNLFDTNIKEESNLTKTSEIKPQIVEQNKNLEKAKTNLLKMFDEDEDESSNELSANKINKKTANLTSKLTAILDPVKLDSKPPQNTGDIYPSRLNTNTQMSSDSKSALRTTVKKPLFLEDDESEKESTPLEKKLPLDQGKSNRIQTNTNLSPDRPKTFKDDPLSITKVVVDTSAIHSHSQKEELVSVPKKEEPKASSVIEQTKEEHSKVIHPFSTFEETSEVKKENKISSRFADLQAV